MPLASDINVVHPIDPCRVSVELRPSLRAATIVLTPERLKELLSYDPAIGSYGLRPTLKAAIRLERRHGFERLMRGIAEGSYSILAEIVRECASTRDDASAILSIRPIGKLIAALRDPCQQVVLALAGYDIAPSKGKPNGKPVPFSEFYADLYRLAAGNLGWPPEQALSATPLEIVEAFKGRADLLKSIFGSAEQECEPLDPATVDHKAGIARLKEIFGTGIGESVR